jgi:hypothetical protein
LELAKQHLDRDVARFENILSKSETLDGLVTDLTASYRDLGDNADWCLLLSEFQLYALRAGQSDTAFTRTYAQYRDRLTELIADTFNRFEFRSELTPRDMASALIGLSHGLALERAASSVKLPMEVTGMAIRALFYGAMERPLAARSS